jgi:hypothetical protein
MRLIDLNLQFIFAFILINFRQQQKEQQQQQENQNSNEDERLLSKLPKLNSYFHSLQEKLLLVDKYELYKLDSVLEDHLTLAIKYLSLIESDSWSSVDLSQSFTWLSDDFLRKLIQMSAQVEARDTLCYCFVNIFRDFTLLFAIDYEFIRSKVCI